MSMAEPQKAGTMRYPTLDSPLPLPPPPLQAGATLLQERKWSMGPNISSQGCEEHRRGPGCAHSQCRAGHSPSKSQAEAPSYLYKAKTFPSAK